MLKHKGRERREEKRRENTRGRRSLCWSFEFSFPGQSLQELLQWGTQKCWSWRIYNPGRCWSLSGITGHLQAESGCCWKGTVLGASCAVQPHPVSCRARAQWKWLHWDSLQGKAFGNYLFYLKKKIDLVNLNFFPANSSSKHLLTSRGETKTIKMTFSFRCHFKILLSWEVYTMFWAACGSCGRKGFVLV